METVNDGYELLIRELKERGFQTKSLNAHGPLIKAVVEILATDEGTKIAFSCARDAITRIKTLQYELNTKERMLEARRDALIRATDEYNRLARIEDTTQKCCEKIKAYIDEQLKDAREFSQKLFECETAEGRDVIRRAQFYRNNIKINSAYDNTAYIKALGEIIARAEAVETTAEIEPIKTEVNDISVTGTKGYFSVYEHHDNNALGLPNKTQIRL